MLRKSNKQCVMISKARISPKFPWLRYIKQLFHKSGSRPVFDPITFWYDRKRKFIENCWHLNELKKLDRAWDLTIQIERTKASNSRQKTKLKYRGVTYYFYISTISLGMLAKTKRESKSTEPP